MQLNWKAHYSGHEDAEEVVAARLRDAPWLSALAPWQRCKSVDIEDVIVPSDPPHYQLMAHLLDEALERTLPPEGGAKIAADGIEGCMRFFVAPGVDIDFERFAEQVRYVLAERRAGEFTQRRPGIDNEQAGHAKPDEASEAMFNYFISQ